MPRTHRKAGGCGGLLVIPELFEGRDRENKEIRDELVSQDGHLSEPWLQMRDPASMNTVQSDWR